MRIYTLLPLFLLVIAACAPPATRVDLAGRAQEVVAHGVDRVTGRALQLVHVHGGSLTHRAVAAAAPRLPL